MNSVSDFLRLLDDIPIGVNEEYVECPVCGHRDDNLIGHCWSGGCISLEKMRKEHPDAPMATVDGRERLRDALNRVKGSYNVKMFDIKETFGVAVGGSVMEVPGKATPQPCTPAVIERYIFRSGLLRSVLYALTEQGEFLYLSGPSGSGKTSVVEQVAARINRGVCRVNHDGDVCRADIIGQHVVAKDEETRQAVMEFSPGPLVLAMERGDIYVADEFDMISPSVAELYKPVLEGKSLILLEDGGREIKPHPEFRFIATANTVGTGDMTGQYAGAQVQNEAMMQRFTIFETVDYPAKREENLVLEHVCGIAEQEVRDRMLKVAEDIRKAYLKEEIQVVFSTRILCNIAKKLKDFGSVQAAYDLGLVNRLRDADRQFVREKCQTVWGSEHYSLKV